MKALALFSGGLDSALAIKIIQEQNIEVEGIYVDIGFESNKEKQTQLKKLAEELGIKIYNTPSPVVNAVVKLTLGLIFCALRKITLTDRNIREGIWKKPMGNLLENKNVGIIGFGRIGRKMAEILHFLGANIFFYDEPTSYLDIKQRINISNFITTSF